VTLDAMIRPWRNGVAQHEEPDAPGTRGRLLSTGKPSGGTTAYWEYHQWPDHDRFEYTTHRDVVQFYMGRTGSEVTYRGKAPLPEEQVDDFLRRRDHSIETAVKLWLNDPQTILIYEGQRLAERHLATR